MQRRSSLRVEATIEWDTNCQLMNWMLIESFMGSHELTPLPERRDLMPWALKLAEGEKESESTAIRSSPS